MDTSIFDFDGDYGARYEALAHRIIPGYGTLFPMVAALIKPELPPQGRVLVVGAGTGVEIVHLKRVRAELRIHGVDPSAQMLELAERRIAAEDLGRGVTLRLGYAADLPSEPAFDAATIFNVLHFLPDDPGEGGKAALLADVARRLRPGGVLVLYGLHGGATSGEHERHLAAWRRYWKIRGMPADHMREFNDRIERGMHYAPGSRYVELALEAGFGSPDLFCKSLLYEGWTFRRVQGVA